MTLCNENFLSPAGFRLDIPGFKSVGFQCTNVNVPGISMNGPVAATPYNDFQLGGDKLNDQELQLTFLIDENCANYALIHNWMVGITYPQKSDQWGNFVEEMKDKDFQNERFIEQLDLYVHILNSNFNTAFKLHFYDAFPVSLNSLEFSTDQTDIQYMKAQVTFKYTYFKLTNSNDKELTLWVYITIDRWVAQRCVMDDDLFEEARRIPVLHAKWLDKYLRVQVLRKEKEYDYNCLYRQKYSFYMGREETAPDEKIIKTEVPIYIKGDPDIIKAQATMDISEKLEDALNNSNNINNRSFQIKNAIDWLRYSRGIDEWRYYPKENEVYLQLKTPPHISYELSDHFTFEVEGAKFMPAYRQKYWDGKLVVLSGTGEIYAGLRENIEQFCQERGYAYDYADNEYFGMPDADELVSFDGVKSFTKKFSALKTEITNTKNLWGIEKGNWSCHQQGQVNLSWFILSFGLQETGQRF